MPGGERRMSDNVQFNKRRSTGPGSKTCLRNASGGVSLDLRAARVDHTLELRALALHEGRELLAGRSHRSAIRRAFSSGGVSASTKALVGRGVAFATVGTSSRALARGGVHALCLSASLVKASA